MLTIQWDPGHSCLGQAPIIIFLFTNHSYNSLEEEEEGIQNTGLFI